MRRKRTTEEIGRLAKEIYGRDIHPRFKDDYDGKVVSIDVDSGDYALGDTISEAARRLRKRRPDAVIWSMRVGYRTMAGIGARNPRWDE